MGRLTRVLGGIVTGVGVVAGSNAVLRRSADDVDSPLGRPMETYRFRGYDVSYTEAGDPNDPDLLLIHGINLAGSSHEFRYVIDALAEHYHVIAPDLPGFGHSDRPPLQYSGSLYVSFLETCLADGFDGRIENPTVVASSLSAAYVACAVARRGSDVAELILVTPTSTTIPWHRPWIRSLLRSPVVGEAAYNLLVSKRAIRYFLADHGFTDAATIPDAWVEYAWQISHQPGARFAPASFLAGMLDLDVDLGETLAGLDVPITLVWGREVDTTPVSAGYGLAETANARLLVFENAGLLPHAEHPAAFVDVLTGDETAGRNHEN
ncbi:MAG: alpha/beta fold hydrolase [Natronomonas sp.]